VSDHHPDVTDALDATAAAAALIEEAPAQPGRLDRLVPRLLALRHELGKFGLVGAIAYAFDFATFNVCLKAIHTDPLTATVAATVVGATLAFFGNRYWTWRHRERSGLHREYALYFLVNLVGLVIGLTCVGLSHYGLGSIWPAFRGLIADNVAKNIVGMALGTLFRFWAYRRFVFRETAPAGGSAGSGRADGRSVGESPDGA
jgi:putative flippase GtrA